MRVLVTGGAGYIGSVLSEALLARDHQVVVYDNLRTGYRDAVVDGTRFVEGDLLERERVEDALRRHRIEAVVHMAGAALVGESVVDPALYYRNNVAAGLALLDAMRAAGVGFLVFSSTCAVYGEPAKRPLDETTPTSPTNPYGESKLAFERALRWYDAAYGLRYMSLRYFNAAGATERSGERHDPESHLIPLVLQVAAGRRSEVVVFGDDYPTRDGTCVRDYVHVLDLAEAHLLALDALAARHESAIYNLGCGGDGYTVREVIETVRRITGRSVPTRVGPRRPGDPAILVADTARVAAGLGWRPGRRDLAPIVESAWRFLRARSASG